MLLNYCYCPYFRTILKYVHHFANIAKMLYPSEESMYCLLPYGKIYMFDEYRQVLQIDVVKQDEEGMTLYLQGPSDYIHAFDLYQIREGQL